MSEYLTVDLYRQNAENLWLSESSSVFSNGKKEHAAVLYETFLKFGKSELVMFVKNLSKEVFGNKEIETLTHQALSSGMRIDVLCQMEPESKKIAENIKKWSEEGLPITLTICKKDSPVVEYGANFCVVDGKAYRFEKDRENTCASACMNDPLSAKTLRSVFFRLRSLA